MREMPNKDNLIPANKRSKSEARKNGKKGGIKSGKVRREKKAIREILTELLQNEVQNQPQFSKLAAKMGIDSKKSIKELFSLICLLNSVKSGNLKDLETLTALLGEDNGSNEVEDLTTLAEMLK